ncbi:MAG: TIGR00269 family protein [Candidatus Helarchaeota archaeon]|nr:TIGR00269 family protein [Candidatus Helarchaeota archaeon]
MICSNCKEKPAVYHRKYSGQKLCKNCFCKSIERKVAKTITKYKMLSKNDKIAFGLSGGKDSVTLLNIMNKMQKEHQNFSINVITVDEGIEKYREDSIKIVDQIIENLNLKYNLVTFKELYGYTLDEIVNILNKKGDFKTKACSYCGILRRRALNKVAKEMGADKLATAHNIDDEAETILMNITRSDITRLLRYDPIPYKKHPHFVPRIKPYREIPEKEISLYAYYKNLPIHSVECPYASESMRRNIKTVMSILEQKNPSVKFNLLKFYDRVFPKNQTDFQKFDNFKACSKCNEPTSSEICKFCELMENIS